MFLDDRGALATHFQCPYWGKQAEREQDFFAFHAELVFVEAGVNKRRIGMRDG